MGWWKLPCLMSVLCLLICQFKVENPKNGRCSSSNGSSSTSSFAAPLAKKQKMMAKIVNGASVVSLYNNLDVVEAIREFGGLQRRAEIALQKMLYLVKEETTFPTGLAGPV